MPETARVVFWFVPYHAHSIPSAGSRSGAWLDTCKGRVASLARARTNAQVVDMMLRSPLTREDSNYWDPLHFSLEVAATLPAQLRRILAGETSPDARLLE